MEIQDVENLAELAKIELSEEEKAKVLSDMEGILGYVKVIESVEVPDIRPDYAVRNIWREDSVENDIVELNSITLPEGCAPGDLFSSTTGVPCTSSSAVINSVTNELVNQFPDAQDGFVKVKKIL
ncbi:MAG: Asp-tRNA(Asn)/Glu-tRNA(Gln) amidotransferase subunit GatC [Patescibacteria group bacterium]